MQLRDLLFSLAIPFAACGHAPPKPQVAPRPVAAAPAAPPATGSKPAPAAPVDPAVALERGRVANDADDHETAARELEAALLAFLDRKGDDLDPADATLEDIFAELGYAYESLQRWSEAEEMMMRRLDVARASKDRYREATAIAALGRTIKRSGDLHRGIALLKQALAIDAELRIEADDPGHLDRLHSLASAYDDLGEHARAARMLEQVLEHERAADPSSSRTATVTQNLALAYRDAGKLEQARTMFETALRLRIVLDGPTHQSLVSPLNGLAGTLKLMGEQEDAVLTFKRVLAIASKTSSVRAIALADLGDTEVEMGDTDVGIAHLDEALRFMRKAYPSGHPETVRTLVKRTQGMLAAKRIDEANADTEEAIRMATVLDAGDGTRASATASWLADTWQAAGHAQRARELRKQVAAKRTPAKQAKRGRAKR
ncbi:MAG TPA: tetratricopeptide repeat protein [Kofleriaceae bacterium]